MQNLISHVVTHARKRKGSANADPPDGQVPICGNSPEVKPQQRNHTIRHESAMRSVLCWEYLSVCRPPAMRRRHPGPSNCPPKVSRDHGKARQVARTRCAECGTNCPWQIVKPPFRCKPLARVWTPPTTLQAEWPDKLLMGRCPRPRLRDSSPSPRPLRVRDNWRYHPAVSEGPLDPDTRDALRRTHGHP